MVAVVNTAFTGMRPGRTPELLRSGEAQRAINLRLTKGEFEVFQAPSPVLTLSSAGTVKTIYRFGQSLNSETQYWFESLVDADFVKGPVADDTEERTYFTGIGGYPRKTNAALATTAAPYPSNSYRLGVKRPTPTPTVVTSGSFAGSALTITSLYTVTYVTSRGEVGGNGPLSTLVTYRAVQTNTVTLPGAPTGNYSITAVRLWRANTGTDATQFQFVVELPVATASYADTKLAADLGETLESLNFDEPSDQMTGLISMPGGTLVGFFNNQLCFSEPGFPYAWPIRYRKPLGAPIVAVASYDQSVIVFTTKSTHIFTGTEPANMTESAPAISQVCQSKRSIVRLMGGIIFASSEGLCMISGSGVQNLTDSLMSSKEWQAYKPSSFSSYSFEDRYIGFFNTGSRTGGLMLNFGADASLSETDVYATAGYRDDKNNALYLVTGNTGLVKWNGSASKLNGIWTSNVTRLPYLVNISAARVESRAYPVTFRLYADGVLKHTQTVTDAKPFRCPGGYLASRYHYEIEGSENILVAGYATSVAELVNG